MAKKVLVIINTLNVGGAETFLMKIFRSIDKDKIIFDFLVSEPIKGIYEDEVKKMGGKVYYGYYKVQHPLKNWLSIVKTVKIGNYKSVFIFSQHPIVFFDLLACILGGATQRVVRSTNSHCGGYFYKYVAYVLRPFMNLLISTRVAPSKEAAVWLFGKSIIEKKGYLQLNNGLDLNLFSYKERERKLFREENELLYKTIIGHIGRFNAQKNHFFLIDVFNEYLALNSNSVLVLIGNGELKDAVEKKIKSLNIQDKVILFDVRSDIPKCLCGFDLLLFPSIYEGMPNVVIEAQSTGLPCLVADSITNDAKVTDLVNFISLGQKPTVWAHKISLILKIKNERAKYKYDLCNSGYSISSVSRIVQEIFL